MISDNEWLFYLGKWELLDNEDYIETLARDYMSYYGRGKKKMSVNILTDAERITLKSMAKYWQEVGKREDTSPLEEELSMVCRKFGYKVLFIIAQYLELTENGVSK